MTKTELNQMLVDAAVRGDCDGVSTTLAQGADIDCRLGHRQTGSRWRVSSLMHAVFLGHEDVVALLLDKGAKTVLETKHHTYTAFGLAVAKNHVPIVRLLLARGVAVPKPSTDFSVLHHAVYNNNAEMVGILIEAGTRIDSFATLVTLGTNCFSRYAITALSQAMHDRYPEIARLLLKHDADINAWEDRYASYSTLAFLVAERNPEAVRLALAWGARVLVQDHFWWHDSPWQDIKETDGADGCLALIRASEEKASPFFASVIWNETEEVLGFLPRGQAADTRGFSGETALIWAALQGNQTVFDALLAAGADVDAEDRSGITALAGASLNGYTEMVRLLLEAGADADGSKQSECLPLLCAVYGNTSMDIVTMLLDRGANIEARDSRGRTALIWAAMREYLELVRLLIEHGADVNARDDRDMTALAHTKESVSYKGDGNHAEVVSLLKKAGAHE